MSIVHFAIDNALLMLISYKGRPDPGGLRYTEMLDRIRGSLKPPLGGRLSVAFVRFIKARPDWDGTNDDTHGEAIGWIYREYLTLA
jgi:hypothetical protein